MPWSEPTLFAPMQGVGAKGVRDILTSLGRPGMICTPFLRVTDQAPNIPWLLSQAERSEDVPLSVQLLGNHAQHLATAAAALTAAGVDVVDLNLGCPSRQVCKKSAGSALLSNSDVVARIVSEMRNACSGRLSVKMRANDGGADATIQTALAIEAAGADFLVLHPRTRGQGYAGVADWELVRLVKSHLRIPVVGNGDCWYAADAVRLMRETGTDAVMIGRPALRNPYIFRQIRELRAGARPYEPTGSDIVAHVERIAEQLASALRHTRHGPEGALKEQIQYLLRAIPEAQRQSLWQRTRQATLLKDVVDAIRPLSEIQTLDIAADGPMRLELTPNHRATRDTTAGVAQ